MEINNNSSQEKPRGKNKVLLIVIVVLVIVAIAIAIAIKQFTQKTPATTTTIPPKPTKNEILVQKQENATEILVQKQENATEISVQKQENATEILAQTQEIAKRGKINTLQNNLKASLGINELEPISPDTLKQFEILTNLIKAGTDRKNIPFSISTKSHSEIKRGVIVTLPGNKNIAVVLYNDYRFIIDPDKIVPFNFSFNNDKFIPLFSYHFTFDISDRILEGDAKSLSELKKFIFNNKSDIEGIFIVGYTCSIGTDEYNLRLSIKRAQHIADNLSETGINIMAIGYGEQFPSNPNTSKELRSENRKAKVYIMFKDNNQ